MIFAKIRKNKIFSLNFTFVFFVLAVILSLTYFSFNSQTVQAEHGPCEYHNVSGHAWSDNIGWISFSCEDEYGIGNGFNYGVDIGEDGVFSGYAWSDTLGWISFNPEVGCPSGTCKAEMDLETKEISGWAKVLVNNEWMSLGGENYGIEVETGSLHGWAWGDTTLGWVSFNCANKGECNDSNYKVLTTITPTVRTDPATNIDSNEETARLNGTLLSLGAEEQAEVWFEWGLNENLSGSTETSKETKTEITSFSDEITVTLGETYYFRALGSNAKGTFKGSIRSFKVTDKEGSIVIDFGDITKEVKVSEDGLIEIID